MFSKKDTSDADSVRSLSSVGSSTIANFNLGNLPKLSFDKDPAASNKGNVTSKDKSLSGDAILLLKGVLNKNHKDNSKVFKSKDSNKKSWKALKGSKLVAIIATKKENDDTTRAMPLLIAPEHQPSAMVNRYGIIPHIIVTCDKSDDPLPPPPAPEPLVWSISERRWRHPQGSKLEASRTVPWLAPWNDEWYRHEGYPRGQGVFGNTIFKKIAGVADQRSGRVHAPIPGMTRGRRFKASKLPKITVIKSSFIDRVKFEVNRHLSLADHILNQRCR